MNTLQPMIENLTFSELSVGQSAKMVRVISIDDINAFALVSGEIDPANMDAKYLPPAGTRNVVAHGMFAGALISGFLGSDFPGAGTIYLEQNLKFQRPVHLGDRLTIALCVLEKEEATHRVRLSCEVHNQRGELVVGGEARVQAPSQKLSRPRSAVPTMHLFDPETRLHSWMNSTIVAPPLTCVVVHPCDAESLSGALDAARYGLIVPLLVGPKARITALADALKLSLAGVALFDTPHSHASAAKAAAMAANGEAAMMMKGSLHTDELMSAVLAEPKLRTGRRMSHVFRFEVPAYSKPLLVTDAAINIAPTLEIKADIVRNVIDLAHALGVALPRVALLSAVETVTPSLVSTLDAAALCKMADRGQISGALLDGPLAFDNAISMEATRIKGIRSEVAGQADILVVPDLEAGNMLAKQLEYLAGAASCGVVLGARVPIALTSRADSATSRVASAALAAVATRMNAKAATGEKP